MSERQHAWVRILMICVLDCLAIIAIGGFTLLLRFEFSFSEQMRTYAVVWMRYLPVQLVITVVIFYLRRMYHYVWRAVSAQEVLEMLPSVLLAFGVSTCVGLLCGWRLPVSVTIMSLICQIIVLIGMRCGLRLLHEFRGTMLRGKGGERIMLIGAGQAGRMLLQEMTTGGKLKGDVCCLIDDNPAKHGKYLDGVRIYGGRDEIERLAEELHITQIILAIPSASAKDRKDILERCKLTGCRSEHEPGQGCTGGRFAGPRSGVAGQGSAERIFERQGGSGHRRRRIHRQ